MTRNNRITADEFFSAFCEQWSRDVEERRFVNKSPYDCRKTWTKDICSLTGFLSRVTERLGGTDPRLAYRAEWYTIDGLIVGGDDTHGKDLAYPSRVYALIEHELGTDIETEAWKLAHWLAPLKILIFYDWCESKKTNSARKDFVEHRLAKFFQVVNAAREFYPEPSDVEYLVIVGTNASPGDPIAWRRTSNDSSMSTPLLGAA